MDYQNDIIKSRKNKHLNYAERMIIQLRLKENVSKYRIAKEINRAINTILNEIRRGTTTQIKQGKKVEIYLADTGKAVYDKHRKNSCRSYKCLDCSSFINFVTDKIKIHSCSPDACMECTIEKGLFALADMVCTKTLYNYIDLGLISVKNIDLPIKLRRNTKSVRVRKHKKN